MLLYTEYVCMHRYCYYLQSQGKEEEILNNKNTTKVIKHPDTQRNTSLSLFWLKIDVKILFTANVCYTLIKVTPSVWAVLLMLKIRTILWLHLTNFCISLSLSSYSTYRICLQILWDTNQLLLPCCLSGKLINCDNHRFFETAVLTLTIPQAETEMFTSTILEPVIM